MIEFDLEGQEFIELNKLLKMLNLAASGGEAKMYIRDGQAILNGEVELQIRKKLRVGDKITFMDKSIIIK